MRNTSIRTIKKEVEREYRYAIKQRVKRNLKEGISVTSIKKYDIKFK